jgi:hypothetical protein
MSFDEILREVKNGRLLYTRHAIQRMSKRGISPEMVESSILRGEVIEEYPDDKYGPSCLIAAQLPSGWIHIVLSLKMPPWVITAYIPEADEWIDFKKRKR